MNTKEQILKQAMLLFAKNGYTGVSMRDLAGAVGLGVSGIYHHFPDKKSLYLEAVQLAFSDKAYAFSEVWESDSSPENKLREFVGRLTDMMLADRDFHRLMQRELLEADDVRMKSLAEDVFKVQFSALIKLLRQLAPAKDAHLMAVSVISLVCYFLEMQPMRRFLPEYEPRHENADVISDHISDLLLNGFNQQDK